ncbi:MAG: AraC family transcriptional regulator [Bacillota bacterium]|nr:AraC family transcriptional regulator [Bacillota bacterium]
MALSPKTVVSGKHTARMTSAAPDFPAFFSDTDLSAAPERWHWRPEFTLSILTEGAMKLSFGGEEYDLRTGDGFFINSGFLSLCASSGDICRQRTILFSGDLIGRMDPKNGACDIFFQKYVLPFSRSDAVPGVVLRRSEPEDKLILDRIDRTWNSGSAETPDYELTVRDCISRILSEILHHPAVSGEAAEKYRRQEDRTKRILAYLEENFIEDLSIGELAVCAGISVSECLRCFRSVLHTTPIQYLKQYRLEKSAEMLSSPEHASENVADIARAVGFADMSYFTRAFRTRYRATPSEWRKTRLQTP